MSWKLNWNYFQNFSILFLTKNIHPTKQSKINIKSLAVSQTKPLGTLHRTSTSICRELYEQPCGAGCWGYLPVNIIKTWKVQQLLKGSKPGGIWSNRGLLSGIRIRSWTLYNDTVSPKTTILYLHLQLDLRSRFSSSSY